MSIDNTPHVPVMLNEMIHYLAPENDKTYIDATFGAGGYTKAILASASCNVIAIDQDPATEIYADAIKETHGANFSYICQNFTEVAKNIENGVIPKVDGIVFDLGVSSMQLDNGDRGFSFMNEGPLDMRMSSQGKSAQDLVNNYSEEELADIIFNYGDERYSRRIAKNIVAERRSAPITHTIQLAHIVRKAVGFYKSKIDTATKTFQAIRIWVNDELESIENILIALPKILNEGAKVIFVSFHSLEDRLIKSYFRQNSQKKIARSKYALQDFTLQNSMFELITYKSVKPSITEIQNNPRARSAKLRAATFINFGNIDA